MLDGPQHPFGFRDARLSVRSRRGAPRRSREVRADRRLQIEGFVRLTHVHGEEGGHRRLDEPLEPLFDRRDGPRQSLGRLPPGRKTSSGVGGELLPEVRDVLEADRDHAIAEEMPRLGDADLRRDRPVLRREQELPDDEPVQAVDLHLHPRDLAERRTRIADQRTQHDLLHAGGEEVQASQEAVDREPGRLDEVLDRHELRALIHDREAGESSDRLVDLLQLAGRQLLAALHADRVAADDVVAGDHARHPLRRRPRVRIDRRLRRNRELLVRPKADPQRAIVLDREAQQRSGSDPVRLRPMLWQRDAEARIPELLHLAGLHLHGLEYVSAPINRYSSGPASGSMFLPSSPAMPGQSLINGTHDGPVEMDRDVDVLVVGAGPAGSTAAKYAALGGADVLLIEKRSEIGTPVRCGEGVAKRWLEEIGLDPSNGFICHEVDGARVIAPDGTTLVLDETRAGNECGYVLERDLFDRHLAKDAAKAGADILIKTSAVGLLREDGTVLGARCEHMGETFDVRARVVIGADGFESQVGRWADLQTHLRTRDIDACLQYTMVGIGGNARLNDVYLGSCAPGGYAWVFWKAPDVANVGIGVNLSKIHDRAEAKRYLDALIARTPALAKGEIVEEVAGAVSVSLPLERTVAGGVMLAGDAARLIDPLTGGGILNGCLSGKFAGEVAALAVEAKDASESALRAYETRWRARMEEELARHYLIKERLIRVDDNTINKVIRTIASVGLERITTQSVLEAIRARHPEILALFDGLL